MKATLRSFGQPIGRWWMMSLLAAFYCFALSIVAEEPDARPAATDSTTKFAASTAVEASVRARMLHELTHGALQVMHRDFFDADDPHESPSASLKDVFHEMSKTFGVTMKWLTVNADVVNVDHQAENAFERTAVEELAAGSATYEQTEGGTFRFAGSIRLSSQCLKCHLKLRTSTEDRVAGLVITMPLEGAKEQRSSSHER